MMHIIKTFFERLVLGVFSGERKPTFNKTEPDKPHRKASLEERKKYQKKRAKYNEQKTEFDAEITAAEECQFSADDQKVVDERVQNLVGYPYWIRASLVSQMQTKTKITIHNLKIYSLNSNILRLPLTYTNICVLFTKKDLLSTP